MAAARSTGETAKDRDDAGFALLLVLWALVLLSLVVTQLLAAGRRETQLAGNLRRAAVAETLADSGIQNSIFQVLTGEYRPPFAPIPLAKLPGGTVTIHIRDLAGLINPNMAPAPLLMALMEECGISPSTAGRLAQSIADWRVPNGDPAALTARYRAAGLAYAPSGQAFQTKDEIGLVIGMTPALAHCLVPHLSVFGDRQVPAAASADPVVLRSLMRMAQQGGIAASMTSEQSGALALDILSEGMSQGARFWREATVSFSAGDPARPYRILTWQQGD